MTAPITASAELAQRPEAVFDFLADLRNHVLLAPDSVELRSRDLPSNLPVQAIVRLRGPLAIRRTATTEIVSTTRPALIAGRASIGTQTRVSIAWTIASQPGGSSVSLRVIVHATGLLDGLVLKLGVRRWLQRRFADALACLPDRLARAAASPDPGRVASLRLRPALEPAA